MEFFFILALGRSGTNFLASLLNKDPNALVYHEPYIDDRKLIGLRYSGCFNKVVNNSLEKRFKNLLKKDTEFKIYGEVNSYLRYEIEWLRKKFNPIIIHLIRDGRDYLRSAYIRTVYTPKEIQLPIIPHDKDPYAEKWQDMTRFQKLCWYWMHTNEFLSKKIKNFVRFENLMIDYDYFNKKILKPTGLNISYECWKKEVKKPRNTSRRRTLRKKIKQNIFFWERAESIKPIPQWTEWDELKIEQFQEICGRTMKKFGYI